MGMGAMKTLHLIIKGNVQGVGYRATAQHYAKKLGIVGAVKNLPNGSVEIYAQGPADRLQEFVGEVKKGPGLAKIQHVFIEECKIQKEYKDFQIIF